MSDFSQDPRKDRHTVRPREGFTTVHFPARPSCPIRLFVPIDHQPKYAYPFVVLFHPDGTNEDYAIRCVPLLSPKNYIVAAPRGPIPIRTGTSEYWTRNLGGYNWSPAADPFLADVLERIADSPHIHPTRRFLIGIGGGTLAALQIARSRPGRYTGVASIRIGSSRRSPGSFSVMVWSTRHGTLSSRPRPLMPALRSRPARPDHREGRNAARPAAPHPLAEALRELNRWIMRGIASATGSLPGLED